MNVPLYLDDGSDELTDIVPNVVGWAVPAAIDTVSPASEPLGALTARVYGSNTKAYRDRLRRANPSLTGTVRVPLS